MGAGAAAELRFFKYGRTGVQIQSRRGGSGWEELAKPTTSPYLDERPLLSPGVPEQREYRMRFCHKDVPTGEWTGVQIVTVGP